MLKCNDTIALFCTGSHNPTRQPPVETENFLKHHYHLHSRFQEDTYQYTSPKRRAAIFLDYLFDDNIRALWALRGGEGTADVIPYLHKHHHKIKQLTPKPLIGFSDITALLIYFVQTYQWPVIHGPGPLQLASQQLTVDTQNTVRKILLGKQPDLMLTRLKPLNLPAQEKKVIQASLIGGNLSLLNISIADLWEIKTSNKIIIIEECNEKPHVIKRTLSYLKRLKKFQRAKAVIFGDMGFSNCKETRENIDNVLHYFAEDCKIPVLKTDSFGHDKKNYPLPFGTKATLETGTGCLSLSYT